MVKKAYGIVVRVLVFLHCEAKVDPQIPLRNIISIGRRNATQLFHKS